MGSKTLVKQKNMSLQGKIKRGEALFGEGKIEQSEKYFLDLLIKTQQNAEILNNLGVIQYYKGNISEAKEYFLKALSQEKDHCDALKNLNIMSQTEKGFNKQPHSLPNDIDKGITCQVGKRKTCSENIKVSIGLPVFNGEQYIAETIESILSQNYSDFELIISDNHSNDNTAEICRKFMSKDRRIKFMQYHSNVGSTRNFSRAFELCSGEYFMWASADDTFEKDYITSLVDVLEKDPEVALCYSATNLIDPNGSVITVYKDNFDLTLSSASQRYRNLIYGLDLCNCLHGLIRSSVLSNTRLIQPDAGAWDCVLLAELSLKGKFVQLQKPMFNRRRFAMNETLDQRYARSSKMRWPHIENERTVISLPICRMIRAHIAAINDSDIELNEKEVLIRDTYHCFLTRFANWIKFEVDRAIKLISMEVFQNAWGQPVKPTGFYPKYREVGKTYINDLLSEIEYALFLIPEYYGIHYARSILLINLGRFEEAMIALSLELKRNPEFGAARDLFEQLDSKLRKSKSNHRSSFVIS